MRKLLYSALAAIGLLLLPSCSDENEISSTDNEVLVSFTVDVADGIQTKSIGDGTTANKLHVRVFEKGNSEGTIGNQLSDLNRDAITFTNKTAEVTLSLVKGKTYNFLFWADSYAVEGSPYTLNANGTITISYGGALSNDESRDAFMATVPNFTVTGTFTKKVELHRPFAQLNFLTTKEDLQHAAAGHVIAGDGSAEIKTKVTLSAVATTLNPFTNTVTGSSEVIFQAYAVPFTMGKAGTGEAASDFTVTAATDNTVTISSKEYYYLATNYFLVAATGDANDAGKEQAVLTSAKLEVADAEGEGLTVTNIPVRWNYRTNIYGDLLTAKGDFHVTIAPSYETEGTPNPDVDVEVKEVTVKTVAEVATALAAGATQVTIEEAPTATSGALIPKIYETSNTKKIELVFQKALTEEYTISYRATNEDTGAVPAEVHITVPTGSENNVTVSLAESKVYVNGEEQTQTSTTPEP